MRLPRPPVIRIASPPDGVDDNSVSNAELRDSAGLSVIGRSVATSGDPADIVAASDGAVLRRSGSALGFGQVVEAGIADAAVTLAKLASIATARFLGRVTASTGFVEALTGTQATSLLDVFTSALKGLVPASGGGTANFLRADGTWAAPSGTAVAGSLAIANAAAPATLNYSTEGTIDWLVQNTGTEARVTAGTGISSKIAGGWLADSFQWVGAGVSPSITAFSAQQPAGTTTATDTTGNTALAAVDTGGFATKSSTTAIGFGFKLRVPSLTTTRVLRIYTGQYSCDVTVTASLVDGSASPVTAVQAQAASTAANRKFTITFNSSSASELIVTVLVTVNNHDGSNNLNVGMMGVTLATS